MTATRSVRTCLVVGILALVAAACGGGGGDTDTTGADGSGGTGAPAPADAVTLCTPERGADPVVNADLPYADVDGVDPALLSLDVHAPAVEGDCPPAPVVVYVHGGGWRGGDKASQQLRKPRPFVNRGWVYASVNYRLSPDPNDLEAPDAVRSPTHGEDVASAVAWIVEEIEAYGGDPTRIALIGHSSGAHLASIVSTNPDLLAAHGLGPDTIACTASLDTQFVDLVHLMESDPDELFLNAFTDDPAVWAAASPLEHVSADDPPHLLVSQDVPVRVDLNERFATALSRVSVDATVVAVDLSHREINEVLGTVGDEVVTPVVLEFFDDCLA